MSMKMTAQEIARILQVNKRSIQIRANEEQWQFEEANGRGGKRRLYIVSQLPEVVRTLIVEHTIVNNESSATVSGKSYLAVDNAVEANSENKINKNKQAALAAMAGTADYPIKVLAKFQLTKLAASFVQQSKIPKVMGYDLFSTKYNCGDIVVDLTVRQAIPSISRITLIRWEKTISNEGIAGLMPKKRMSYQSLIESDKDLSEFCVAMLYEYPHVKATQVHEGLIARFHNSGKKIPSEKTIRRWLTKWKRENASLYTKITNPDAWKNKFMSAMGKMDENIERINQLWEFDSTPADVMLKDGRHSLIGIIDVKTRRPKVVLHPTSNSEGICLVIRKAIIDWGIPEVARTDNGADYTSIQITSVFEALGIEHQKTRPFSGEEKPYIERFFKTFSHGVAELLKGYVGHNVSERQAIEARKTFAERLLAKQGKDKSTVDLNLTAQELQEFIDKWIDSRYMHVPHSNLGNKTPFEVYAESRDQIRTLSDERILDVMLQPVPSNRGLRKVGKEGIKVSGGVYIAPELGAVIGDEVLCKWDAHNAGRVYVFNRINSEFLCIAVDPEIESIGLSRQEIAHQAKQQQKAKVAAQMKQIKRTAASNNVANIANEILDNYEKQNSAMVALPKQSIEHQNMMTQSALQALDAKPSTEHSDKLKSEFEQRKEQLEIEAQAAASKAATPIFKNPSDRAMYLKKQLVMGNELEEKDANWLRIWQEKNRAASQRFDQLLEETGLANHTHTSQAHNQ